MTLSIQLTNESWTFRFYHRYKCTHLNPYIYKISENLPSQASQQAGDYQIITVASVLFSNKIRSESFYLVPLRLFQTPAITHRLYACIVRILKQSGSIMLLLITEA